MEFVSHIVRAYCNAIGNNEERASKAITSVGSSVLSGITLTKILGVSVLAFAKSQVSHMIYSLHVFFYFEKKSHLRVARIVDIFLTTSSSFSLRVH